MAVPFSLLRAVSVISSSRAASDRVFEEELVEIAQPEHQQRARNLLLDRVVLPHQRRGCRFRVHGETSIVHVALSSWFRGYELFLDWKSRAKLFSKLMTTVK